jgi:aspartate/methionine/tyrosine aminotransferase
MEWHFSRRLAWAATENALARAEAAARASGRPLLDLTVSNPTQVGLPYPDDDIGRAFANATTSPYQPTPFGLPGARAAVVGDYARRGVEVDVSQVVLTASSSESYALLFKLLGDPGQSVLCPEPSYPLFEYLARLENLTPRPYRLRFDGGWHIDFPSLDLADAAAIILVSPNNPTCSFVSSDDFDRLAGLAAEHGRALIVDEVFADFPISPAAGAVTAVAGRTSPALVFSLGGLSKSCGLPHLKLGWLAATGPTALVNDALARLELIADTYLSVGTPVQLALPGLLQAGAAIRRQIIERVQHNRRALAQALGTHSPCSLLPAEAGWCAILRVPEIMSDEAWASALLEQDSVLVQPGYFFDLAMGATLVLSLIVQEHVFAEGVARLLARVAAM